MEFEGDKFREQFRKYAEIANELRQKSPKEIEGLVREFVHSKADAGDLTSSIRDAVAKHSKKGIETVSEFIRKEFRQEFEDVARKGRTELSQFIEKIVCLIEERFGGINDDGSMKRPRKEQAWRTDVDDPPHSDGHHGTSPKPEPKAAKAAGTKKAAAKKSGAKKAAAKKSASKKRDAEADED
jgi:hypothetical protein